MPDSSLISYPKLALLFIATLLSAASYADTCPAVSQLKFLPDGYFVAEGGWRSENKYKGVSDPRPIFRQVNIVKSANGKTNLNGCEYIIKNGRSFSMMMLPPPSYASATPEGANWRPVAKSSSITQYECMPWSSDQACEFAVIFKAGNDVVTAANPFETPPKTNLHSEVK